MGLFAHYQADPASVYRAAADTEAKVKPLASLRGAVKSQHAHAAAATSGVLVPPLTSALDPVVKIAEAVMRDVASPAGCTRFWATPSRRTTPMSTGSTSATTRQRQQLRPERPSLWDYLGSGKLADYCDDMKTLMASSAWRVPRTSRSSPRRRRVVW